MIALLILAVLICWSIVAKPEKTDDEAQEEYLKNLKGDKHE